MSTESEVKAAIARAMEKLRPDQQRRVLEKTLIQQRQELKKLQLKKDDVEARRDALKSLEAWLGTNPVPVLEKNDCSRLHKFFDAARQGLIIAHTDYEERSTSGENTSGVWEVYQHTFVVKHDWAAAFEGAEGVSEDFKLPYELCSFEFRVSGKTIIVFCAQNGDTRISTPVLETDGYWYSPGISANDQPFFMFAWKQITAICIALDAEVASQSVIRAPHKLNKKRAERGQIPLLEYRVVDLAKRHRIANPSVPQGTGGKKRLHFRRGHWRHFETSKTWVRWCLVGDPDLGFIQKHYSL